MTGIRSAFLLKGFSILSKILSLALIPFVLAEGVFAELFVIQSVSLLVSRVISFGALDTLILVYRDYKHAQDVFIRFMLFVVALGSVVFVGSFFLFGKDVTFILLMTLCLVISAFVGGHVRKRSVEHYEYILNAPWVLVCVFYILAWLLEYNYDVSQSVYIYSFSFAVLPVLLFVRELHRAGKQKSNSPSVVWFIGRVADHGLRVSASDWMVLVLMRSYFLVAYWSGVPVSDTEALMFSGFEAVYGMFLVYTNRVFSADLSDGKSSNKTLAGLHSKVFMYSSVVVMFSYAFFFLLKLNPYPGLLKGRLSDIGGSFDVFVLFSFLFLFFPILSLIRMKMLSCDLHRALIVMLLLGAVISMMGSVSFVVFDLKVFYALSANILFFVVMGLFFYKSVMSSIGD